MNPPPRQIDGADVLEWAWCDQCFGYVKDTEGKNPISVHGLAICKYANSEIIYRFSCDREWETIQDADYMSVDEAKKLLPEQYKQQPANWMTMESTRSG